MLLLWNQFSNPRASSFAVEIQQSCLGSGTSSTLAVETVWWKCSTDGKTKKKKNLCLSQSHYTLYIDICLLVNCMNKINLLISLDSSMVSVSFGGQLVSNLSLFTQNTLSCFICGSVPIQDTCISQAICIYTWTIS